MRQHMVLAAFALCTGLAACGDTTTEQVLYGGGAGLAGSLLLDTNPIAGAAVGAAANVIYCEQSQSSC
ncbi:MAG: hypothetical protein AAF408_04940 [Pseudomonadota bacterium]